MTADCNVSISQFTVSTYLLYIFFYNNNNNQEQYVVHTKKMLCIRHSQFHELRENTEQKESSTTTNVQTKGSK